MSNAYSVRSTPVATRMLRSPALNLFKSTNALGLRHLAMDWDGIKAQIAQHEGHLACVVTGAGEDHEGCAGQLSQVVCQVAVLHHSQADV